MPRTQPKKKRPVYDHQLAAKVRCLAVECGLSETYVRQLLAAQRRPVNRVLADKWDQSLHNLMAPALPRSR